MPRYDAILFDFDGVLADTEPVHYRCWAEVLKPFDITFTWETYRTHGIGLTDRDLLEFLGRQIHPPVPLERMWEAYPLKQELFRQTTLREPPIPPVTVDLLKSLGEYKLALVTSTGRFEVRPLLERAGIRPYLAAEIYAEDVTRHKPDAEPYRTAAARLGVTRALVVEDSEAGLASGRAAGFDVLQITDAARTAELVRAALSLAG